MDPAAEVLSPCLAGAHGAFSGSLAVDLLALVFGGHTPAVCAVVLEPPDAVLGVGADSASEDLVVEPEHHVVSVWVHTVVEFGVLAAELGALDGTRALMVDAAVAAG